MRSPPVHIHVSSLTRRELRRRRRRPATLPLLSVAALIAADAALVLAASADRLF